MKEDSANLHLGIDATNLRQGGGRTHLIELLGAADPQRHGFRRVVVWGSRSTLSMLEDRDWLVKRNPSAQEGGLVRRTLWQRFELSRHARAEGCNVLYVPGGSHAADFHPIVTMSRNMLPFEWREIRRFGFSLTTLRLVLLRRSQSRSFKSAEGMIFLTGYAHNSVRVVTGELRGTTVIIPHGLNGRFVCRPRLQNSITDYSLANPFRILYVSIVNHYKHQWHVVEAVGTLRQMTGWPLVLDLVGPSYSSAMARLKSTLRIWDPRSEWVNYHGALPYGALDQMYRRADVGLFASSCENMPNILLETMAAGLPVACSNRGPMPEVLGDSGVYFDPERPSEILHAVRQVIEAPGLRDRLAHASFERALQFTWQRCANDTFAFLAEIGRRYV